MPLGGAAFQLAQPLPRPSPPTGWSWRLARAVATTPPETPSPAHESADAYARVRAGYEVTLPAVRKSDDQPIRAHLVHGPVQLAPAIAIDLSSPDQAVVRVRS